jgi:hypothetical protein
MKSILIGEDAKGRSLHLTEKMRASTHMHVIGGSGTGKSKYLEWLIRQDIRAGHGLCVIDWHGTLFKDVLNYCTQMDVGMFSDERSVILINPSKPDQVTGFNPFMNQGEDVSTQAANRRKATVKVWGENDTDRTPTLERVITAIYTVAVELRQPLANAALLLDYENSELRQYAIDNISNERAKRVLQKWQTITKSSDWDSEVLSTDNRFNRFLASTSVKRFLGMTEGNIDLRDIMDNQKILLVNLGASGYLDRDSAKVFAVLLLNEFFETAMRRANEISPRDIKPFVLYMDEFQEYINDDIAAMLDQVRKGGLHMVLAHQHLGHFADKPQLRKSVFTNARIRAVFGGLDFEDGAMIANEMFLPDLNMRQIKKAYHHTAHLYREETRTSYSRNAGYGTSTGETWDRSRGFTEGRSETRGSGWSEGTGHSTTEGQGSSRSGGRGRSSGSGFSARGNPEGIPDPTFGGQVEGWYTESEGESEFTADGESDFSSETYSESSSESAFQSESTSSSRSRATSRGGSYGENESHSEGETVVPVWVPIPIKELGHEAEWGREEKVSNIVEMLKLQQQRHCFIKFDTEKTQPMQTPFVRDYSHSEEFLLEYEQAIYKSQGAKPADQVDEIIKDNQLKFLAEAQAAYTIDAVTADSTPEGQKHPRNQARPRIKIKPK